MLRIELDLRQREFSSLLVGEKWFSLTVTVLWLLTRNEEEVETEEIGGSTIKRGGSKDTEDGKGEDPLKGDDLDGQLFEAKLTKGQQAEGVSEVLVVAKNDVSLSDDKVHPDEDVGHQPQGRAVTANGHGTVPEEDGGLIDQAEDVKDLSPPELAMDEEQGEGQHKEVVEYKVRSHIGSRGKVLFIRAPELADIAQLRDEKYDPVQPVMSKCLGYMFPRIENSPVDASDYLGLGEGIEVVVVGKGVEGLAMLLLWSAVVLAMGASVDAKTDDEEPGNRSGRLVSPDRATLIRRTLDERVVWDEDE
ncbi:hypothetical protein McanMca71_006017 [Microsporum canis]